MKGGCNGIGAWVFNSVLNAGILLVFLNFYFRRRLRKRRAKENGNINGGDHLKSSGKKAEVEALEKDKCV
jgi:hypothetical protein